MFFGRKGKATRADSGGKGRTGRDSGARRTAATNKTGAQPQATRQAKGAAGARGAADGKGKGATGKTKADAGKAKAGKTTKTGGGGQQPSRAQAEAQIKQMMNDGSLDKFKTLMRAQSPADVADEYPQETVNLIRNWLNDPNR